MHIYWVFANGVRIRYVVRIPNIWCSKIGDYVPNTSPAAGSGLAVPRIDISFGLVVRSQVSVERKLIEENLTWVVSG